MMRSSIGACPKCHATREHRFYDRVADAYGCIRCGKLQYRGLEIVEAPKVALPTKYDAVTTGQYRPRRRASDGVNWEERGQV